MDRSTWDSDERLEDRDVTAAFDRLEDPRLDRRNLYPLSEIFFLALAASPAGIRS
jgi:hypothetical protein